MAKVQAIDDLMRAGEAPLPRVRRELLAVLNVDVTTYQEGRATAMAGRLLERLDRPAEREPDEDPDLRREWFELDLLLNMSRVLGWEVSPGEWHAGVSDRVQWLEREGAAILDSLDPFEAFDVWRERQTAG